MQISVAVKFQNQGAEDLHVFARAAVDGRIYQSYHGIIQLLSWRAEARQSGGKKQASYFNQPGSSSTGQHQGTAAANNSSSSRWQQ